MAASRKKESRLLTADGADVVFIVGIVVAILYTTVIWESIKHGLVPGWDNSKLFARAYLH